MADWGSAIAENIDSQASLKFDSNGSRLLVKTGSSVQVYESSSCTRLFAEDKQVVGAVLSREGVLTWSGKSVISTNFSGTVTFEGFHEETVTGAWVDEKTTTAISWAEDGSVILWDLATGQKLFVHWHPQQVKKCIPSLNPFEILVLDHYGDMIVWKPCGNHEIGRRTGTQLNHFNKLELTGP